MPIRPEMKALYPPDWKAKGAKGWKLERRQGCRRR